MQSISTLILLASMCTTAPPRAVEVESVIVTLLNEAEVPASERGRLLKLNVREGQQVAADEELARIDETEAVLALDRAEVDLARAREEAKNTVKVQLAKQELAVAEAELKRADEARKKFDRAVSDTEYDRLKLSVGKAKLSVENAQRDLEIAQFTWQLSEAEMAIAKRNVARRKITAPISGVVVQINRRKGEWVEAGEPVLRIVQLDRLQVEGFLDAAHLDQNMVGRPVLLNITDRGMGAGEFRGTLQFVSPLIDPVDRKVRVIAEVDNAAGRLRPGMRGSMTIEAMSSPAVDGDAP